ncbi:unnamed protein product [Schistosoma margrebowiei]|uniref:Uncharacterized protein n=1 Tax=Schistosoma margrebowiei TaxID=48269 RepID=A0A183LVW8_9TREM|nr:unnamed protein product [Schistosoma margrebowiei]
MRTSTSEGKHRIQWTARNQLEDWNFEGDLAVLSHTHEQMQMKTTSVALFSAAVSLNIHEEKDKIFKYNTENTNQVTLEEVKILTYLVDVIAEQGGSDADVKARTDKARTTFLRSKNI